LAVKAAREQVTSDGIVASGFDEWLQGKRGKGLYLEYDPDQAFAGLEDQLRGGQAFALKEEA
jgi:hypothetical protein